MEDRSIMEAMFDVSIKQSKSYKKIADFIRENCDEAVFMTAARVGETVGVSESTIVRFAKKIGYDGYPEMQKAMEAWVKSKYESIQQAEAVAGMQEQPEVLQSVLLSDIDNIADTLKSINPAVFENAADTILGAEHVYIVGLRSCEPLADFLAFYLQMIRGSVVLVRTTSVTEMFEQMIRVNEKDAVIGISFPRYSMRTLKAMEFANDRNARVIAITDNEHSPMKLYSSCNLFAKSDSISLVDSLVAPLSVINALVVAMCMRCPDEVRQNLRNLEETWSNYQVYLNDEIDFIGEDQVLHYSLKKEGKES